MRTGAQPHPVRKLVIGERTQRARVCIMVSEPSCIARWVTPLDLLPQDHRPRVLSALCWLLWFCLKEGEFGGVRFFFVCLVSLFGVGFILFLEVDVCFCFSWERLL